MKNDFDLIVDKAKLAVKLLHKSYAQQFINPTPLVYWLFVAVQTDCKIQPLMYKVWLLLE